MIVISKLKEKDLPRFVELWNQEYFVLTSSQFKMTNEKAVKGFKSKMFDYYGIYNEKQLIGFMLLKEDKNLLLIKHMTVDKKFRRRGIGSLLLKKADEIAKKKKLKLKTEVIKNNEKAKNFYLKNGFQLIKYDQNENQYILVKNY